MKLARILLILFALLVVLGPTAQAQEPVYLPVILKDDHSRLEPMAAGQIHGWVWIKHENWIAPWEAETRVFLASPDGSFVGVLAHGDYRLTVPPGVYDLYGYSFVEMPDGNLRPYGECRQGVVVEAGQDKLVGLVLTYPIRFR